DAAAVEGATYRPHVGYFEPRELAGEFAARARENGATFEPHTPVEDVVVTDGRVTGVVVDGERVAAGAVVCAADISNVKTVLVDGDVLKEDFKLKASLDGPRRDVEASRDYLLEKFGVPEPGWMVGGELS
ncbi:MAG: FAD-dependent oxidoreductase, partial [Halobacteriales archaeon]|nr:FAD-dependent oxidoreductase [Halobacteriales archaeon]